MQVKIAALFCAMCLLLSGCGANLLDRSYSASSPHSASYQDSTDSSVLRANNYQELVNAILMLLDQRAERGTIRLYGKDRENGTQLAQNACIEVQQETATGAYLLEYITCFGSDNPTFCELSLQISYRVPPDTTLIDATTSDAVPALIAEARKQDAPSVAIRIGSFTADAGALRAQIAQTQAECGAEDEQWETVFYPREEEPGLIEIRFASAGE